MAAWSASQPPEGMAEEAANVAVRRFQWLKHHVDDFQNVVDLNEAIQCPVPEISLPFMMAPAAR